MAGSHLARSGQVDSLARNKWRRSPQASVLLRGGDLSAVQTVGVVETMATPTRVWMVEPGAAMARLARTADLKAE